MLQSFEKLGKQPFKKCDFCNTLWGNFFHTAKMTPIFRKYAAVMCRIDENAITTPIIFNLPFKIREKNSLYMRELDSFPHIIRKMHKHTPVFCADIRNFILFSQKQQKQHILPLQFRGKSSLIMKGQISTLKNVQMDCYKICRFNKLA